MPPNPQLISDGTPVSIADVLGGVFDALICRTRGAGGNVQNSAGVAKNEDLVSNFKGLRACSSAVRAVDS